MASQLFISDDLCQLNIFANFQWLIIIFLGFIPAQCIKTPAFWPASKHVSFATICLSAFRPKEARTPQPLLRTFLTSLLSLNAWMCLRPVDFLDFLKWVLMKLFFCMCNNEKPWIICVNHFYHGDVRLFSSKFQIKKWNGTGQVVNTQMCYGKLCTYLYAHYWVTLIHFIYTK